MFMIVTGENDYPVFECMIPYVLKNDAALTQSMGQSMLNSALDSVDEKQWQTQSMYLRQVDLFKAEKNPY